jgi:hypothetical protein
MTTSIYAIKDFENIIWKGKHIITLPDDTIQIINSLTEQVGSPNYIKTPSFTTNDKSFSKKKKKPSDQLNPDDWNTVRNFKKTKLTEKEGIQKDIDALRLLINKLTDKTYDKIIEKIFEAIDIIIDTEYENNDDNMALSTVGYAIFNMATNNKFNSNIYAKLCNELKMKYDFMSHIIDDNINEFMKLFENMKFTSANDDYDKFCETNILNDKRRSMSLFLCNLYSYDVVNFNSIIEYINNIQSQIMNNINNEQDIPKIEELSENLFILLTNISYNTLKNHNDWNNIYQQLVQIKNINLQNSCGISHKTKFKHMDILDKCK